MTTTNNNKKILDLKRWEFCTPAPGNTVAGSFIVSSRHYRQQQLMLYSATAAYLYNPSEDGYVQLPSPALAGTFGAGSCGVSTACSTGATVGTASLTATGGTTSTINTNQTLARDLRGYSVHILSGPNAGATLTIRSNTVGANAVITVDAQGAAFSASTIYRLITPRWYVLNAGTVTTASFRVYDFATNTWQTLSNTGLPATWGVDGRLVSTPSWMDTAYLQFAGGTATSATSTSISNSAKTWAAGQWVNRQVRIVSGTGAGQIRTITASDATTLTVAAWTVTPDSTSVYSIEGNDDFLYLLGNGGVTMYRYQISTNTWTTVAPVAARAAAPGAGMSGHWVWGTSDAGWMDESAIINGRRIYSFRAGAVAGNPLDYYDIASNTWVSGVVYAPAVETITGGSKCVYNEDFLYVTKENTGRWFRYCFVTNEMDPWGTMIYPQGAALMGDTAFDVTYFDGATKITFIYMVLNTSNAVLRQMVI